MIAGQTTYVAADASVLVNFLHVDRLDLLGSLPGYRFQVPAEVDQEITDSVQQSRFQTGIASGAIDRCVADQLRELEIYAELPRALGPGERACIALAENRAWTFASDDGRAVKEAVRRNAVMQILNTPQTLLLAIRAGTLTVVEADRIKLELQQRRRFTMKFDTFQQFFPPSKN